VFSATIKSKTEKQRQTKVDTKDRTCCDTRRRIMTHYRLARPSISTAWCGLLRPYHVRLCQFQTHIAYWWWLTAGQLGCVFTLSIMAATSRTSRYVAQLNLTMTYSHGLLSNATTRAGADLGGKRTMDMPQCSRRIFSTH